MIQRFYLSHAVIQVQQQWNEIAAALSTVQKKKKKKLQPENTFELENRGGCSSAGRAGRLVIERSLVQIPAQGKAELHVEVSLSKILNPPIAHQWAGDLSREYPALALRQGWDWLQQQHPVTPWKGISGYG